MEPRGRSRARLTGAIQRAVALGVATFVATLVTATSLPGCCPDCTDSCENCPATTSYCLVVPGRDSGGARTDAFCTPLPDACKDDGSCECIRQAQLTLQEFNPRTATCEVDPKLGITIDMCEEACPGPIDASGGECPSGCCCIQWEPPA